MFGNHDSGGPDDMLSGLALLGVIFLILCALDLTGTIDLVGFLNSLGR